MHDTTWILRNMAALIDLNGLHRGKQFAEHGPHDRLDICAVAYVLAEEIGPQDTPAEFYTDEEGSLRLIESSARAMAAIRAISEVIGPVCETEMLPGFWVPDYVEHVSSWATPVDGSPPPTVSEVIGRILRAANALAVQTPAA